MFRQALKEEVEVAQVSDTDANINWMSALNDVQVVVHTAARVHVMNETEVDELTECRRANVAGTLELARQSVEAGCRSFYIY
jgi:nucleoside-diphosphate-sugar epimerase